MPQGFQAFFLDTFALARRWSAGFAPERLRNNDAHERIGRDENGSEGEREIIRETSFAMLGQYPVF